MVLGSYAGHPSSWQSPWSRGPGAACFAAPGFQGSLRNSQYSHGLGAHQKLSVTDCQARKANRRKA